MGTTLTGTTPQDTYDSLIKVTDNGPLSGSLKVLTDGLGNNSAISLSTSAASVTGTLAVSSNVTLTSSGVSVRLGNATANAGANILIAGASSTKNWSLGVQQNVSGALEFTPTATNGATTLGTTPAMVILDAGNVGIGTDAPNRKLVVVSADSEQVILTSTNASNLCGTFLNPANTTFSAFIGATGNDAVIHNTGAERFRVTANGVTFNGDTAAANALDDYEEGTWTPVLRGASTAGTYELSLVNAVYTKIGRQVTASCFVTLDSVITGGGTAYAQITGLPFAKGANQQAVGAVFLSGVDFTADYVIVNFIGNSSTSTLYFSEVRDNAVGGDMPIAGFAATDSISFTITYFV